jgi:hypothetical protein
MMVVPPWFGQVGVESHALPEFLGDERKKRMKQPQRVAEHEIDHGDRVLAACGGTRIVRINRRLEDGFARLHIPIAIFVPKEAIERVGGFVELVVVQRVGDFANRRVELQENPLVVAREKFRAKFILGFAALHLTETAGVPKLVAEVSAEFHGLLVEK